MIFLGVAIINKAQFDYKTAPLSLDFFMAEHFIDLLKEVFVGPIAELFMPQSYLYKEELKPEKTLKDELSNEYTKFVLDSELFSQPGYENSEKRRFKKVQDTIENNEQEQYGLISRL